MPTTEWLCTISTANGMWYQRLSKLKIPRSRACFVVTAQLNTVAAITSAATSSDQNDSPVGDVVGGTIPCAVAGDGGSPAAAGPAGHNTTVPATKSEAAIRAPA